MEKLKTTTLITFIVLIVYTGISLLNDTFHIGSWDLASKAVFVIIESILLVLFMATILEKED